MRHINGKIRVTCLISVYEKTKLIAALYPGDDENVQRFVRKAIREEIKKREKLRETTTIAPDVVREPGRVWEGLDGEPDAQSPTTLPRRSARVHSDATSDGVPDFLKNK